MTAVPQVDSTESHEGDSIAAAHALVCRVAEQRDDNEADSDLQNDTPVRYGQRASLQQWRLWQANRPDDRFG